MRVRELPEYDNVRILFNEYLSINSDFLLNENYKIDLAFKAGNLIVCCFTNKESFTSESKIKYVKLYNAYIPAASRDFRISQMNGYTQEDKEKVQKALPNCIVENGHVITGYN